MYNMHVYHCTPPSFNQYILTDTCINCYETTYTYTSVMILNYKDGKGHTNLSPREPYLNFKLVIALAHLICFPPQQYLKIRNA